MANDFTPDELGILQRAGFKAPSPTPSPTPAVPATPAAPQEFSQDELSILDRAGFKQRADTKVASPFRETFINSPEELQETVDEKGLIDTLTAKGNKLQKKIADFVGGTEEDIVQEATRTGKPPLGKITRRVVGETLSELIPTTPKAVAVDTALLFGPGLAAKGVRAAATSIAKSSVGKMATKQLKSLGIKNAESVRRRIQALARQDPTPTDLTSPIPTGRRPKQTDIGRLIDESPALPGPRARKVKVRKPGTKTVFRTRTIKPKQVKFARVQDTKQARRIAEQGVNAPKTPPARLSMSERASLKDEFKKARQFPKKETFFPLMADFLFSTGSRLKTMGAGGSKLGATMTKALMTGELRSGFAKAFSASGLRKMTEAQRQNFIDVLDLGKKPIDKSVEILAAGVRKIQNIIAKEAAELELMIRRQGGSAVPWVGMKNHFPHILDIKRTEDFVKGINDEVIQQVVKKRPRLAATSVGKRAKQLEGLARKILNQPKGKLTMSKLQKALGKVEIEVRRHKDTVFSPLERARTVDHEFWIRNPEAALSIYFDGAFKRLELVRALKIKPGTKNPTKWVEDFINKNIPDSLDRETAKKLVQATLGVRPDRASNAFLSKAGRFTATALMGMSSLSNATQGAFGSAVRVNLIDAFKATAESWFGRAAFTGTTKAQARDFARKAGALIEDVAQDEALEKFASKRFLERSGFTASEEMNRVISANAGRHYAKRIEEALLKARSAEKQSLWDRTFNVNLKRELRVLKLDEDAIVKRGYMTDFEVRKVANEVTNVTQGRARPIDMPAFIQDPIGKATFQLKTFVFNWSKLVVQEVTKPLNPLNPSEFNPRPLIRYIAAGAVLGEPVARLRQLISGRERPETISQVFGSRKKGQTTGFSPETERRIARTLDAIGWVGGVGIFREVFSLFSGDARALTPPMVSLIQGAGLQAGDFLEGIADEEKRTGLAEDAVAAVGRRGVPFAVASLPAKIGGLPGFAVGLPLLAVSRAIGERAGEIREVVEEAPVIGLRRAVNRRLER